MIIVDSKIFLGRSSLSTKRIVINLPRWTPQHAALANYRRLVLLDLSMFRCPSTGFT